MILTHWVADDYSLDRLFAQSNMETGISQRAHIKRESNRIGLLQVLLKSERFSNSPIYIT
jgi:hypothetical protein